MRAAFVLLLVLSGERVDFDSNMTPHFTANQVKNTEAATREGLARWAATPHGRALLQSFTDAEYTVNVTEDSSENAIGRAPQPGLATLIAANDREKPKSYDIVLNPLLFRMPHGTTPLPHQPATPADLMSAAWAGEMLHVSFYARGISLPHHPREDFQREWRAAAEELGMPMLTHDDGDERTYRRRRVFVGDR